MSFFDKIKNTFVESDEPKPEAKVSAPAPTKSQPTLPSSVTSSLNDVSAKDVPSLIDPANAEQCLETEIAAHPEFKLAKDFFDVVASMKDVIPDEATRFKAAIAASRADSTALLQAVNVSRVVLAEAEKYFQDSFVTSKATDIEQSKHMSVEVQAEIDKMTQKLGDLSTQKGQIDQHVRDSTVALEKAKIDYKSALDTVSTRYTTLADKLAKYLGVANG